MTFPNREKEEQQRRRDDEAHCRFALQMFKIF